MANRRLLRSQCRCFDVRDGGEFRPESPWTIPVPFNAARAPYAFARRAKMERPAQFPSGAAIKVETDAVPFKTVTVSFPSAESEGDVLLYKVEIARKGNGGAWELFARGAFFGCSKNSPCVWTLQKVTSIPILSPLQSGDGMLSGFPDPGHTF